MVGEQMVLVDPRRRPAELPSLGFLDYKAPLGQTYDREVLRQNAELLERPWRLRVKGKVVEIHLVPSSRCTSSSRHRREDLTNRELGR